MPNTTNQKFKITVPITRCYLRKNADGTEKYVIEGMASNTDLDLTGERMAESAIEAMAKSLSSQAVIFKNEHGEEWDAEFGEVTALYATDDHKLMMEAELDPDHYRTKTLVKALEKGRQLGLSIGGFVLDSAMEWVEELSRKVKTYKDILLAEISVTGTPAVPDTWLTNITKSVKDWKEEPMPKPLQLPVEKTEDPTTVAAEQPEEPQAPAEHATTPPASSAEATQPNEAGTNNDDNQPVETDAAGQEDDQTQPDEAETAKSAPDQATDDTSQVAKAAIFGSFAEADVAEISVRALTEELSWQVWRAVYTFEDDERTKDERKSHVAAALAEYSQIVQSVANALIENGVEAEAEKAFVLPSAQDLTKSLADKDSQMAELTKSLEAKADELAEVNKALTDKTSELETAQHSLAEVETTKSELATELETIKGRKTLAFNEGHAKPLS